MSRSNAPDEWKAFLFSFFGDVFLLLLMRLIGVAFIVSPGEKIINQCGFTAPDVNDRNRVTTMLPLFDVRHCPDPAGCCTI